ncbi:MAG: hypothetical protein ABFQ64_00860, partial [Campylobacterota bacterium]
MKTFNKAFYFPLLFLFFLFNLTTSAGAAPIPFTNVQIDGQNSVTINGSILQIGNQLICKNGNDGNGNSGADGGTCTEPDPGTPNNDWLQYRAKIDTSINAPFNTMAKLVMQSGDEVLLARLYWSARTTDEANASSARAREIQIKGPASTTYTQLTALEEDHGWDNTIDYGVSVDVTEYVKSNGAGDYYVGDILTRSGEKSIYASWQLVVVVKNAARSLKNITIYDGFESVYQSSITVDASGFITPTGTDLFNANLFLYTGESDADYGDSVEILAGDGTTWHLLTDGQGTTSDVTNASVYSPDYLSTGYRSDEDGMADPNFRNVLGVDIDKLPINDKLDASQQFLSNSQTSTQIRLTSTTDRYSLNMFALETEVYVPEFCYDYAYKQQGKYFTELNSGDNNPRIVGNVLLHEEVEVTVFLRNLVESSIQVNNMVVNISDINETQAPYINGSTSWAMVPRIVPEAISESDIDSAPTYIHGIDIGELSSNDYFYIYYKLNPQQSDLDMPLNVEATYSISLDDVTIPYILKLGKNIKMCSNSNYDYEPTPGTVNMVHNDYYSNGNTYYNLPTQITSREGNFKVISIDPDTDAPVGIVENSGVWVELINASAFHDTFTSCKELESAISPRVRVEFDANTSSVMFNRQTLIDIAIAENAKADANNSSYVPKLLASSDFYKEANENTAFRISYVKNTENGSYLQWTDEDEDNLWLLSNFTQAVQDIGKCVVPVFYFDKNGNWQAGADGNGVTTVASACGNNGKAEISVSNKEACEECIYGNFTELICSRDNFSLRPEAILIKLNDQNQTDSTVAKIKIGDDISGVPVSSGNQLHMAAGYQYYVEVNATNHLNNAASPGYTKTYGITNADKYLYVWDDNNSACNDETDHQLDIRFLEGKAEQNTSINQVGLYSLKQIDKEWTTVDNNPDFMSHHGDVNSKYFLSKNTPDCILDSSITRDVTASAVTSPLQGCDITSNHNSSGSNLEYRDYSIEIHPYKFQMTSIMPQVGINHLDVNDTSITTSPFGKPYVYMSDMSFNNNRDQNMSYHLNGNIVAAGYNDVQLTNFVDSCYAKPLDLNVSKSDTTLLDESGNQIFFQAKFHARDIAGAVMSAHDVDVNETVGSANPISIQTTDKHFPKLLNGAMNTILNINYNRDINVSVNPKSVIFSSYTANNSITFNADMSATTTAKGNAEKLIPADNNITFYYGRTNAPRQRFVGPTGDAFIYYEVYCNGTGCNKNTLQDLAGSTYTDDPRWFKNTKHVVATFGNSGTVTHKAATTLVSPTAAAPYDNTVTGQTKVPLAYDGSRGYTYKTTMQNSAPGWLIYNKYNGDATTVLNNEFEVEFVSG